MQVNATYLYGLLNAEGWTLHAIAGLLGNTQTESTHNPGIWQNLTPNKGGYGLTQWTPYTKYTNWCSSRGLDKSKMESAVARLRFEVEHPNEQWVVHSKYPLTFPEFIHSTESPYYLAMTFLNNYEMPEVIDQPKRGTQAEYWYQYLSGEEPPNPPGPPDPPGPPGPPGPSPQVYYGGRGILIPLLKNRIGGKNFGTINQGRTRQIIV